MNKYNEIMNRVRVDDDMKKRLLENLAKETEADNKLSDNAKAGDESQTGKSKISKFSSRKFNEIKKYAYIAAACGVLFIGAYAVIKTVGLNSSPAMDSATYAPVAESPAATPEAIKDYANDSSMMMEEAAESDAMIMDSEEAAAEDALVIEAETSEALVTAGASESGVYLVRQDWADDVKSSLNDLLATYGENGTAPAENPYAVFDFDNTTSIFDVEEQLAVYQLEVMAFAIEPGKLSNVLLTGLNDVDSDLTGFGYGKGSLNDWISDISDAYGKLWDKYGPFTAKGIDESRRSEMQADPFWIEFSTKMRALYSLIYDVQSSNIAYPWVTYWFTGMTGEEVYDLAKAAFTEYKDVDTSVVTWTSPETIQSRTGVVNFDWTSGIQVTENTKELWCALDSNGIDVWVCSASCIDAIRAAVDVFGLHDYCTGVLAMTNKKDTDGKYLAEYDDKEGCGYYANINGSWSRMKRPTKAQTQGIGKVTAIVNAIAPEYNNKGPIAGFMDSTGDFNFCTEFETLKLVVCFNRANRKVTDGGGLIAELAIYQKDTLKYDLKKANESGDTLYVLQGRDENGKRTLRNSNSTILFDSEKETLFKNADNYAQLQKMIDDNMTTKDILNNWALKSPAAENDFGFDIGFLEEYAGYHSHH